MQNQTKEDGCYHCLYAYHQSQNIGNISRSTAIRILKFILSGKDHLTKIEKLGNIPINSLFDSELERRFVEEIAQTGNENRIIRQIGHSDKLPVAIFTDGLIYHKDKVADDTLTREAIRRSERYRVWALSWRYVQSVFQAQGDYVTPTLAPEKMPSVAKMSTFELLMRYLDMDNAQTLFEAQARAYALSLLETFKATNSLVFIDWNDAVNSQVHFTVTRKKAHTGKRLWRGRTAFLRQDDSDLESER